MSNNNPVSVANLIKKIMNSNMNNTDKNAAIKALEDAKKADALQEEADAAQEKADAAQKKADAAQEEADYSEKILSNNSLNELVKIMEDPSGKKPNTQSGGKKSKKKDPVRKAPVRKAPKKKSSPKKST